MIVRLKSLYMLYFPGYLLCMCRHIQRFLYRPSILLHTSQLKTSCIRAYNLLSFLFHHQQLLAMHFFGFFIDIECFLCARKTNIPVTRRGVCPFPIVTMSRDIPLVLRNVVVSSVRPRSEQRVRTTKLHHTLHTAALT